MDLTATQYILWRFEGNEDREAMEMRADDVETADPRPHRLHGSHLVACAPDQEEDAVRPDVVLDRRQRGRLGYEYEVRLQGHQDTVWVPRAQMAAMGCLGMAAREDERQAAQRSLEGRPLTTPGVEAHLAGFGLGAEEASHRRLGALSHGQRARAVLAAATWLAPHLLVLDEPTNYLDGPALKAQGRRVQPGRSSKGPRHPSRGCFFSCCFSASAIERHPGLSRGGPASHYHHHKEEEEEEEEEEKEEKEEKEGGGGGGRREEEEEEEEDPLPLLTTYGGGGGGGGGGGKQAHHLAQGHTHETKTNRRTGKGRPSEGRGPLVGFGRGCGCFPSRSFGMLSWHVFWERREINCRSSSRVSWIGARHPRRRLGAAAGARSARKGGRRRKESFGSASGALRAQGSGASADPRNLRGPLKQSR
ncbi:unnamed protein product [Prorocentrum cordatum]|uniref:ABC transporter domain-containing protein n=1 Tax=Prorocentrum cordatum TaxID=2364126 RepID=A0ABN9VCX6_9DINO|nr:unnamed protein product [Polarella glacialis]